MNEAPKPVTALTDETFTALLEAHYPLLRYLIRRYERMVDQRADRFGECAAELWRQRAKYDPTHGAFGTWMDRYVRRVCERQRRAAGRLKRGGGQTPVSLESRAALRLPDSGPSPERIVVGRTEQARALAMVATLPDPDRRAIEAALAGQSDVAVARATGVSVATARGRRVWAQTKVRWALHNEDGGR